MNTEEILTAIEYRMLVIQKTIDGNPMEADTLMETAFEEERLDELLNLYNWIKDNREDV